jgi:hypothetical protein
MKFMIRFMVPALALLVSACGTYSPLKHQDKQTFTGLALGEVRVNKEFQLAGWFDGAMSARQGANVASLEPGIAEIESVHYDPQSNTQAQAAMKQSGFDLKAGIAREFEQIIKQKPALAKTPASHTLHFTVEAFTLGLKPLSGYGANLGLQAELRNSAGSTAWKNYVYVTHFDGSLPHQSLESYLKNPAELRKTYEMALALLVKKAITSLEVELNDRATEYVDNLTGDYVPLEPLKPVKPATILPAPAKSANGTPNAKQATKPAAQPGKKMIYNPLTDQMEEETNCDGFCGLPGGLKLDGKNLFD